MKIFGVLALIGLLTFGAVSANANEDAAPVVASGTLATLMAVNPSLMGPTMVLGTGIAIAYCQSQMQKDAQGYVTYQSPKCNGGSATPVVGNLTQNPYNTVGKKCIPTPRGGYNCES